MWQWAPNGGTGWSNWNSLGGYVTSISVNTSNNGYLEVYAVGSSSTPWVISQTGGGWGNWVNLGGRVHDLAVANDNGGTVVLGVGVDSLDQDGEMWRNYIGDYLGTLGQIWRDALQPAL
jgi:hypothetical protein